MKRFEILVMFFIVVLFHENATYGDFQTRVVNVGTVTIPSGTGVSYDFTGRSGESTGLQPTSGTASTAIFSPIYPGSSYTGANIHLAYYIDSVSNPNGGALSVAVSRFESPAGDLGGSAGTLVEVQASLGSVPVQPDDSVDGGNGCDKCCGMPAWNISEPFISLWLHDEPLGYQPTIGPNVSFQLDFKQRETIVGFFTNYFSVGKKWSCSWISCVISGPPSNVGPHDNWTMFFPDGGMRTLRGDTDYVTNGHLTGNTNTGFTMSYPNGSKDVYGFIVTNNAGVFYQAYITEHWNSQAQKITFNYAGYDNTFPIVRLLTVVDGDGRTNSIFYATNNPYSTNLISHVVDAFGRTNFLKYDNNGCLTNIIDVAGISSSITYDANTNVTSLTTPYGTTSFSIVDPVNSADGRSILVTQPDGGHQLYLYTNGAPGIVAAYATSEVPDTTVGSIVFTNSFDTNNLDLRNTFYWGPRQYAALSTTNISSFTSADFRKARMQHWLRDGFFVEPTLSLAREPSPDSAGNIEGQKTWYDYYYKIGKEYVGMQALPLFVARVLPDGTTSFTCTERNSYGLVTTEISTYSGNGGVALRTNLYAYAANGVDRIAATNALGILVSSNIFNADHLVATNFNALGEKTVYTYDSSNRLATVTAPNGLVTSNVYGSDGFLAQRIVIGFSTNTYTYANGLVSTHTDERGLTTTQLWDNLQRLVSISYPDGTTVSNRYTYLDLIGTKDRLDHWSYVGFDSMRRKIAETNANAAVTLYSYCICGSLDFILDALTNATHFYYDNQGNVTNTTYADGYSVTRTYDLLRRTTKIADSGGNTITNYFNNQGLQFAVSNTLGRLQFTTFDALGRPTNTVDANGIAVGMAYDNLNRMISRNYPDDGVEQWGYTANFSGATSYTNQLSQITRYGYDLAQRKIAETNANNEVTLFGLSSSGDLLTLTDGKKQVTTWNVDEYGRPTNKIDAANNLIFAYKYDANSRLTNRWTPAKGATTYKYDAVGNLTDIVYPVSPAISLRYDILNRLTNMVDAVGTTAYGYDAAGQLLFEDGPWASDIVSYTNVNRLRTGLGVQQPSGAWAQSYGYDSTRRLTNVTSQVGAFGYGYISGTPNLVSRIALPNGAYITNSYDSVARLLNTALKNSGGTVLDSQGYAYNVGNQRTVETNAPGDYRNYTYDNIGQLIWAKGKEPGGATNRLNEQFGYAYDAAGNLNLRTNNAFVQIFNVNNLNQLSTINRSGTLTVAGNTSSQATNVTANSLVAALYGDFTFAKDGFPLVNGTTNFTAIARNANANADTNTVSVNLAATNSFAYDLNGNMLTNGTEILVWNDENELVTNFVAGVWKSEFVYDGKLRRRIQRDYSWNGTSWIMTNEIRFIYDGNVVIQHRDGNNSPTLTLTRGNDLSKTLHGAGGIGGLLALQSTISNQLSTVFYHSDGNGNVTCLVNTNQLIVARAEYDPFGNFLALSGPKAYVNPYWFSSKAVHWLSGKYDYLYRWYALNLQRWLNRDPWHEVGFETTRVADQSSLLSRVKYNRNEQLHASNDPYGMVRNDPIDLTDPLGLDPALSCLLSMLVANELEKQWWKKTQGAYKCPEGKNLWDYPVKDSWSVRHCALGYFANKTGANAACLTVFNIEWERYEIARYREWWYKGLGWWYNDTSNDMYSVFSGAHVNSPEDCIPCECKKK